MSADSSRWIDLAPARVDGWFQQIVESAPEFRELCDIVGERYFAFALVAGVRIVALAVDRVTPDASVVTFQVGDDGAQQDLALDEFRRRATLSLLGNDPLPTDLPHEPGAEDLRRVIGAKTLLLAPMFGVELKALQQEGNRATLVRAVVHGEEQEVAPDLLRDILIDSVRALVPERRTQRPFAMDLSLVAEAEEALATGNHAKVVTLLGTWPTPLAVLLRTAEGEALAPSVRSTIARGLGALGSAFVLDGRFEWAEEVLGLAIRWSRDQVVTADLYRRIGESCIARERPGEAIGVLRRALTLGASGVKVLPLLSKCYLARRKYVAAMACVDLASAAGAQDAELAPLRTAARAHIGPEWDVLRARVEGPARAPTTIAPQNRAKDA